MKLLLAVFISSLALTVHAGGVNIVGDYKIEKEIMVWSTSQEECESDHGSWSKEDEVCALPTQDSASIKKNGSAYKLSVSTIGSNYHMCEFEGNAVLVNKNTLISRVKAEEYNSESDSIVKVNCVVTAKISASGKLSVSTNQHCQSFCGANAWLEASDMSKEK